MSSGILILNPMDDLRTLYECNFTQKAVKSYFLKFIDGGDFENSIICTAGRLML